MWSLDGWIQHAGVCVTVEKENIMTELKQMEQLKEYSLHYFFSGSVEAAPHFINFNSNVYNVFYMMFSTELWGVRTHKASLAGASVFSPDYSQGKKHLTCSLVQASSNLSWYDMFFFVVSLWYKSPERCLWLSAPNTPVPSEDVHFKQL